jgi:hypothetical protein
MCTLGKEEEGGKKTSLINIKTQNTNQYIRSQVNTTPPSKERTAVSTATTPTNQPALSQNNIKKCKEMFGHDCILTT